MTVAEYEAYIQSIDEVENKIIDDSKYPVVRDNKIKICCKTTLELSEICQWKNQRRNQKQRWLKNLYVKIWSWVHLAKRLKL